jgi:serine/threonine-protein kinase
VAGTNLALGDKVDLFVSTGPAKAPVPDVIGETEGQAKSDLHNANFIAKVVPQTSSNATPGTVTSETPVAGTPEVPGTIVTIVVAKAPTTAAVPDVRGQQASAATTTLKQAGFKVSQQPKDVTNQSQNGTVLSENPPHGTSAKKGSTVTITVGHYMGGPPTTPTTPTTTTPTTPTTPTGG